MFSDYYPVLFNNHEKLDWNRLVVCNFKNKNSRISTRNDVEHKLNRAAHNNIVLNIFCQEDEQHRDLIFPQGDSR